MGAGDEATQELILGLHKYLGRIPTEEEVMTFIYGTEEEKLEILNKDKE